MLGGKGANLCEMTQIGLNVPPGFVITTETCLAYLNDPQRKLPVGLMEDVRKQILAMEKTTGKISINKYKRFNLNVSLTP